MFVIIETTTNDIKIANLISKTLLDKQLSPCVQTIKNVISSYLWKNKVLTDNEIILRIKANSNNYDEITNIIKTLHNYDNPELISYKFNILLNEYKTWFSDSSI